MDTLTYDDFLQRVNIQDVLQDAGYQHYRRDGMKYPSYVRIGSDGRKVSGDKFLVNAGGWGCFQPPEQKVYNVISFIKEHPDFFKDYKPGMDKDHLVNLVCNRLLNHPMADREARIIVPNRNVKPFHLSDYEITRYSANPRNVFGQKAMDGFFKPRGINHETQAVFKDHFFLATKKRENGLAYANLAFPLTIPDKEGVVGLEERGKINREGKSYKGKAEGSNGTEGLWIANLSGKPLDKVENVLWFESAYDGMAYYQLHKDEAEKQNAVYVSTGGSPTIMQFRGMIQATRQANHILCFDNDIAGKQFAHNFIDVSKSMSEETIRKNPLGITDAERSEYLGTLRNQSDIFSGDTDYLPKAIGKFYGRYESDSEEYYSSRQSGLVCKEDLKVLQDKLIASKEEYRQAMQDTFGFSILAERELPDLPYKDWNDVIIDKKAWSLMEQSAGNSQQSEQNEIKSTFHR